MSKPVRRTFEGGEGIDGRSVDAMSKRFQRTIPSHAQSFHARKNHLLKSKSAINSANSEPAGNEEANTGGAGQEI